MIVLLFKSRTLTINTMRKFAYIAGAVVSLFMFSCSESVDVSARYVFKEEIIAGYLQKHEQYSEYCKLLKQVPVSMVSNTSVYQLLSARGNYTVFAPTNEAIQLYLDSLVKKNLIPEASWDAFTDSAKLDSVRKVIVYNSIIDGGDENGYFEVNSFPEGAAGATTAEIEVPNMNDRKLVVKYTGDPDSILINDCMIDKINHDILAINGVVHSMHDVVAPSGDSMAFLLKNMIESNKGGYVVMAKLIRACGLMDTLDRIKDDVYEYRAEDRPDDSETDVARVLVGVYAESGGFVDRLDGVARVFDERLTVARKADRFAYAVEKRDPEFVFKMLYLYRHGGLRIAESFRSFRKRMALYHLKKDLTAVIHK